MRILPRSVEKLIESFEKLPGIGPKSASRLTFYLLHVPQRDLDQFGEAIQKLKSTTVFCSKCFNIGESDPCVICSSPQRDESTVCVVEQPIDILSIEKTGKYKGVYHVLHGSINPLNNIGPDEIRIAELLKRLDSDTIKEVILATNLSLEGEATAMYIRGEIRKTVRYNVRLSRLAHGLPVGADLEYADELTLTRAIEGRDEY